MGERSSNEAVSDDQELARQLLAGWPAPEAMYEVRDMTCVKLDDRVEATFSVENKNDFSWPFDIRVSFRTESGEITERNTSPGFWEAGEAVEVTQWAGKPERFSQTPTCDVTINHGPDLAFRDAELKAETYERLGWDPVSETRTGDK